METKQLLDNAIELIYEFAEDRDWLCCDLFEIPEEKEICEETCEDFNRGCIIRYLKNYKKI